MSAQLGLTASFLSVALLAGLLPAQEKARTVAELRKENAALRQQVKTLQAQRDAKKNAENRESAPKISELEAAIQAAGRGLTIRLVRWDGPLSNGDYRKSVEKLRRATQKLNPINDSAKARKIVDEIERILLDVRRELWKLEQAGKKKARTRSRRRTSNENRAGYEFSRPQV